jgi:hypothetical protein
LVDTCRCSSPRCRWRPTSTNHSGSNTNDGRSPTKCVGSNSPQDDPHVLDRDPLDYEDPHDGADHPEQTECPAHHRSQTNRTALHDPLLSLLPSEDSKKPGQVPAISAELILPVAARAMDPAWPQPERVRSPEASRRISPWRFLSATYEISLLPLSSGRHRAKVTFRSESGLYLSAYDSGLLCAAAS